MAAQFVWLLSKNTETLVNPFGLEHAGTKVTEDDIRCMVQESKEDGDVDEVEQDIVEREDGKGLLFDD